MTKRFNIAHRNFIFMFGYPPKLPKNIKFDQDAYAEELEKCVKDKVDYTIEKYGTVPLKDNPLPDVIID